MPLGGQNREFVFEIIPAGNVYGRPVVLHQDTWIDHISLSKTNVTVLAIQSVIEEPSYIYRDRYLDTRHALINSNVTSPSGSGKPLTVFIETQTGTGYNHVVTALYNRDPKFGELLYDLTKAAPSATLRSSYDARNDVLYLGINDVKSAEDEEIEAGVYLGYAAEGDARPRAAMIFGVRRRRPEERSHLIEIVANALRILQRQVREAFEKAD